MASNLLSRTSQKTGKTVYYWHRRVPTKLVPLIRKRFWRESLSTSERTAAQREASKLNADAEAEISAAKLEYERQRAAVARLTPAERTIVEQAGGLAALRKRTKAIHTDMRLNDAVAAMLRSTAGTDQDGPPIDLDALEIEVANAEALAAALRRQYERNRVILGKEPPRPRRSLWHRLQ